MAETRSHFLSLLHFSLFFAFTFSLLFPPILSRKVSLERTTVFDVSASIERTRQVLKFDPQSLQSVLEEDEHKIGEGSFVLSLRPRSSLHKPHHKDYESLTLSRLARDSARVNSITTKLNFALGKFNVSGLKPVEIAIQPEDLQSPVTSGISQGSGEYFTRLGIGTPAKQYYMVVDTGGDINWIQCQPCSDCYQQSDPVYNPSDSSSYGSLSCSSSQCNSLQISSCSSSSDSCLYQVTYGDGSSSDGNLVTETVSFGSSGSIPKVTIGCGHDNEGLFVAAAGLLGLGGGSLSLPSQIKAKSFSYCLVDRDSTTSSTLEFNSARPADSVTAPLLRNSKVPTFFYVGVTGLSVGGQLLSISPSLFEINPSGDGGIIVDSGTAITRLTTPAYNSLRDSFRRLTQNLPSAGSFSLLDTCYDLSAMTRVTVPTVAFHFAGGETLLLHAKNYLVPVSAGGRYCFAFAPTSGSLSIIGNVQQQGTRVSYDFANSAVGFSADKC